MVTWIEISADYRCNNRCVGCPAVDHGGPSMATLQVLAALRDGRRDGARRLWLGGGEPTTRPDLVRIVAAARSLGYEAVKLQTNGMMLAYPEVVERLVAAGVTEINVSIKGARAATHDRLTRTPGCFDLMCRAIENAAAHPVRLEGDYLAYRSNVGELPEAARDFAARGLAHLNVWLLSAAGAPEARDEVPRISDLVESLAAAAAHIPITSLHTPPCTLPAELTAARFHAPELDLRVINPGGHAFMLQDSPIEGGHYVSGCAACAERRRCTGARRDYVEIHGEDELRPIPAR